MPRKILNPTTRNGTGALAEIYKVPASTQTVVSTAVLLNTTATTATVTLRVAAANAADDVSQTLALVDLAPGDRAAYTEGWALAATDVIRCNAPTGVAITLFGQEDAA